MWIRAGESFILVYDITSKKSFQEIPSLKEKILRGKDASKVPMVLVGNKCDLQSKREVRCNNTLTHCTATATITQLHTHKHHTPQSHHYNKLHHTFHNTQHNMPLQLSPTLFITCFCRCQQVKEQHWPKAWAVHSLSAVPRKNSM